MKKLALFFTAMLITSIVSAQFPISFGPKVGFNTTTLSTDIDEIKTDFKANFQAGAFLRLGIKSYIQPELLFTTKGGIFRNDDPGAVFGASEIKLTTLDVPILVGIRILDLKIANLRVMAGPVASFVIDKEVQNIVNAENPVTVDDIRDANWALQVGAGLDLLMFTLDVRYEYGMSDISEIPETDLKNHLVSVTLGWKIL
ncbi:MAG TPA: porin family protein [Bacteroidales bacterium]|nr:porin family protein [Bacteroidales bacterium]